MQGCDDKVVRRSVGQDERDIVCRSDVPSGRLGKDGTMSTPTVSFEADIKPLFRERIVIDAQSVRPVVLHDVQEHAAAIAAAVKKGPCRVTVRWPAERVDLFERWVEQGKPA